jgi:hypothetical protein
LDLAKPKYLSEMFNQLVITGGISDSFFFANDIHSEFICQGFTYPNQTLPTQPNPIQSNPPPSPLPNLLKERTKLKQLQKLTPGARAYLPFLLVKD